MHTKVSDTITKVQLKNREIFLVGTAHVSRESVDEVEQVIKEHKPDNVCIELDEQRFKSIKDKDKWSKLDILQIVKNKQTFLMMGNLILSASQKRMGLDMGVKPGEEMMKAVDVCDELGIPFDFADRSIQLTLRRAWGLSSLWGKMKLMSALLSFAFSDESISEEELEEMKKNSATHNVMSEVSDFLPSAKKVLVDERDQFLASKIYSAEGKRIVAIVGAAHVPGILEWLEGFENETRSTDLNDISHVPPKGIFSKTIPWLFPLAIIGAIVYRFITDGPSGGLEGIMSWVGWNGTLSAIGALIALANPLSIVLAFVAAPLTSLVPVVGAGMVVAVLEVFLKKPLVGDLESVTDDMSNIKGFYKNRFLRILLITLLTSIGSTIGTIAAGGSIFSSLFG